MDTVSVIQTSLLIAFALSLVIFGLVRFRVKRYEPLTRVLEVERDFYKTVANYTILGIKFPPDSEGEENDLEGRVVKQREKIENYVKYAPLGYSLATFIIMFLATVFTIS